MNELATILRQIESLAGKEEKSKLGELVKNLMIISQLSQDIEELGDEEAKKFAKRIAKKTDALITQLVKEVLEALESLDKELGDKLREKVEGLFPEGSEEIEEGIEKDTSS